MFLAPKNRSFLTNFPKVPIVTCISIDKAGIFENASSFFRHSLAIFFALMYNEYVCGYLSVNKFGSKNNYIQER